jgi:F-type H+-transporting ATPase subunit gamma
MAKTREIKSRIKAVGNIRRITKTMQMIATSKFAKAQQRALAAKPFTEGVFRLVRELAETSGAGEITHPLIAGPEKGFQPGAKELWLIITSDRGLCGPYNGSVLRTAMVELRQGDPNSRELELVGKKGAAFLKFAGQKIARHHTKFGDNPRREEIDRLANEYIARFTAGEITGLKIVYMRFVSAGRQKPEAVQILPLKPPAREDGEAPKGVIYEFTPPADELLGELLPVTVRATLNQAFSDAIVSEHIARMVAMKSATDNAGKMSKILSTRYNRARQSQITTELTEIISGAQALE